MHFITKLTLTALLVTGVASSADTGCGADMPVDYMTYPVPDAVEESPYALSIGGKAVPIQRAGSIDLAYYARIYTVKPLSVTLSVKAAGKTTIDLKPDRFRENMELGEGDITFDVTGPGPRVFSCSVDGRELPPFFLLVDQYDPKAEHPDMPGMVDISGCGVASGGLQTSVIQKALDELAARPEGGTLYFGPGVYLTGSLRVGNNTTIYLAPGALIQGSSNPDDYIEHENGRQLILFENCSNSSIYGYGVIDGSGCVLQKAHKTKAHLVDAINCKNISFKGVVFRNAAAWNLHLLGCEKVRIDNLNIISDWAAVNTDGIDPDCSTDVTITNYFGCCGDDGIAVKASGRAGILRPTRNIRVSDSVIVTRKTALKVGTESREDISDIVFENNDVVASARGIGLWCFDGHRFSDITFRDIRMDLREVEGEGMSGEPYRVFIEEREGVGRLENLLFEGIRARAPYCSLFLGHPDSHLDNVTIKDCSWEIKPRSIKTDKRAVLELSNCRNFTLENVDVNWHDRQQPLWTSFINQENTDNVVIRSSTEYHK